jgi:hypothetical protein
MLTVPLRRPGAAAAALALVVALLLAAPALAQYPLTSGSLAVSGGGSPSAPLRPGAVVGLAGGGFQPGARVEIWMRSEPVRLATVTASGAGAIDVAVTIPTDAPAGRHTVEARGSAPDGGVVVLRAPIVVANGPAVDPLGAHGAAPATDPASAPGEAAGASGAAGAFGAGTLPFTGLPLALVVLAGAGLLLAGGALLTLTRRRSEG